MTDLPDRMERTIMSPPIEEVRAKDARLALAIDLLREVRGTLRTDQHDGHRRIARKIDRYLEQIHE